MKEDHFTAREVGVLIEALRSEFQVVIEIVSPLPERISAVEERLSAIEIDVRTIKDSLPNLFKRVLRIETKLDL